MDEGGKQTEKIKRQGSQNGIIQRYLANASDVLSSIGLRCTLQNDNGSEWLILGCRYSFLLNFRIFLVMLYFAYQIFK